MSTESVSGAEPLDIVYVPEVSAEFKVPAGTLRWWRHAGYGPRSFKIGRRIAYRRADVAAWVEEQRNSDPLTGGVA